MRTPGPACAPALLLLFGLLLSGSSGAQGNPHSAPDSASCMQCHLHQPKAPPTGNMAHRTDMSRLRGDGIDMCITCHQDSADMHPLGEALDFPVPPDLPLDRHQGMTCLTCLTCHYVHGRLDSDRPWASVSFMDRMTDSERMHKTYLLRRNNAEGALCLICHDTSGSSP